MSFPRPPRILVNAIPAMRVSTGIGRYVLSLYGAMKRMYPDSLEIAFFTGSQVVYELKNTHAQPGGMRSSSPFWKLPPLLSLAARYTLMRKREAILARVVKDFDLFHETSFFPPPLAKTPVLFTLHDMSLLRFPDWHPLERALFFQGLYRRRYRYADAILAVSQHTLADSLLLLPFLRELPATVTHLGIDEQVFYPRPQSEVSATLERLSVPERFVLCVGSGDPRKNVDSLLRLFAQRQLDAPLVLAGWSGWHSAEAQGKVLHLGYVSDDELACLYSAARFFAYPSFYEGFGLPVLEALACGCPVLASRAASIPEAGRGLAVYFDPASPDDLARKVTRMLSEPTWLEDMRRELAKTPLDCGWDRTAQATHQAIWSLLA